MWPKLEKPSLVQNPNLQKESLPNDKYPPQLKERKNKVDPLKI